MTKESWFHFQQRQVSFLQRVRNNFGVYWPTISCTEKITFLGVKRPDVKLTTHFHLVQKLRVSGAVPPFLSMGSWKAHEQHKLII